MKPRHYKLGIAQRMMLRALDTDGPWHSSSAWHYGSISQTRRIMVSLVDRGLATHKYTKEHGSVFTITEAGRRARGVSTPCPTPPNTTKPSPMPLPPWLQPKPPSPA